MLNRRMIGIVLVFAAIELLIVGGLGAWAAVELGFPYVALTPVSLAVYGLAGFYAVKAAGSGALAGGLVGLADSATWALSGGFGHQPTTPDATTGAKVFTVLLVSLTALALGWFGGWMARQLRCSAHG